MRFYYPLKSQRIFIDSPLFYALDKDPNFIAQTKKNGWRIQIHKHNEEVNIFTRHNKPLQQVAPDINWNLIQELILTTIKARSVIIDGEFLHRRTETKNSFYVWDLFELNNSLVRLPYKERKQLLETTLTQHSTFQIAKDFQAGEFNTLWEQLSPPEDEGLVIKDLNEPLYINFSKTIESPRQFKILKT